MQNFKVTRSESRTLTGPERSDTSVRLLHRRGRKRRRELDAVQRCRTSSQLLFWEKEHIPLRWLPLLLSLRREGSTATHCEQPAAAASSFLSHWKLLKLFRASLSVKCCSGTWKSFPFTAQRLLVLFSSDQLLPWMIWFHQLLWGISGYLSAEGWTVFTTKILCLLLSAGKGAHSGIRF